MSKEIVRGEIPYVEIPVKFLKDDELLMAGIKGSSLPPDFKISPWLTDEIIGETALAAELGRELGFVLIHDNKGNIYRSTYTAMGDKDRINMPIEAGRQLWKGPFKPLLLNHAHLPHDDTGSPLEGFSSDEMRGDWYNMFCFTRDFGNPFYSVARFGGSFWIAQRSEERYSRTATQYFIDQGLSVPPDAIDCYVYDIARRGLSTDGVCTANETIERRGRINKKMAQLRGFNLYLVDLATRQGRQVV